MDRFVYGTEKQYAELKKTLQDGKCHVYKNCTLPEGFSVREFRIGFEKCLSDHRSYKILVDFGIKYTGRRKVPPLLKILLENGELTFLDFNDLREFLLSLKILY